MINGEKDLSEVAWNVTKDPIVAASISYSTIAEFTALSTTTIGATVGTAFAETTLASVVLVMRTSLVPRSEAVAPVFLAALAIGAKCKKINLYHKEVKM